MNTYPETYVIVGVRSSVVTDLWRGDYRKNTFNPSSVGSAQTAHDSLYTFLLLNLHGFFKCISLKKYNYINIVFISVDV